MKKRQIKITYFLFDTKIITGGAKIILEQINRLIERGYAIDVLSTAPQPRWFKLKTRVKQIKDDKWNEALGKTDLIIVTYWELAKIAYEIARKNNTPIAYYLSGDEFFFVDFSKTSWDGPIYCLANDRLFMNKYQFDHSRLKRVINKSNQSYRLPMKIIAISDLVKKLLKERFQKKSTVVYPGINRDIFYPRRKSHTKKICILAVGPEQVFRKGIVDIYKALIKLKSEGYKFKLIRISPEPQTYFDLPCRYIADLPESQLGKFYASADIFVSNTYYDSLPLPTLEAMASGAAVITSDNEGARQYARDGYNCLMFPKGDINRMAEEIKLLIDKPDLRKKLIKNGLITAKRFDWEISIDKLEKIYLNIINKRKI